MSTNRQSVHSQRRDSIIQVRTKEFESARGVSRKAAADIEPSQMSENVKYTRRKQWGFTWHISPSELSSQWDSVTSHQLDHSCLVEYHREEGLQVAAGWAYVQ